MPCTFLSESRFRRLLKISGTVKLVEYKFVSGTRGRKLQAAILNAPESKDPQKQPALHEKTELRSASRFIFGIDDDLEAAYTVLCRSSRIRNLVHRYHGLRLIKAPDLYESLLITILGQQVSVTAAQSQRRRLMTTFGEKIRFEDQDYYGMPDPERVTDIGESGLRDIGFSRQKARYVIEAAREISAGRLNPQSFHDKPYGWVIERLMEIPGIGKWTAEIVAMRGLGFQDVFPAGDLGLQVAAQRTFGMANRPSEAELRELSNRWKGWRSYAALYLWMTLMEDGHA